MQIIKKCSFYFLLTIISCNSSPEKVNNQESQTQPDSLSANNKTNNSDTTIGGCYSQVFKRDTVILQLEVKGNNASGPLSYNLYQKDRNDGSIKAEVADSVITGWYLFRSEGIISVRQVAWRIKPGQLWPATGEMIQRNDTTLFAKPDQLQYDNTKPFIKIKCII